MKLYSHRLSGNCHKVRLLLGFLGLDYEEHLVDFEGGEHQQAPFLTLNPAGTIPVLDDDGTVIVDSQAILVYLAARYAEGHWGASGSDRPRTDDPLALLRLKQDSARPQPGPAARSAGPAGRHGERDRPLGKSPAHPG